MLILRLFVMLKVLSKIWTATGLATIRLKYSLHRGNQKTGAMEGSSCCDGMADRDVLEAEVVTGDREAGLLIMTTEDLMVLAVDRLEGLAIAKAILTTIDSNTQMDLFIQLKITAQVPAQETNKKSHSRSASHT